MEDRKELISMSTAHATQLTADSVGKGPWRICKNKTNEVLATLDKNLTEKQVFEFMDVAKKYELEAFNIGIQFQKELSDTYWKSIESGLKRVIAELTAANDKLADRLDTFIGD